MNKYLVTYNVNLIHEVTIEATSKKDAKVKFEDMYNNEQDSLPEYHDISHDVTDVELVGDARSAYKIADDIVMGLLEIGSDLVNVEVFSSNVWDTYQQLMTLVRETRDERGRE